MPCKERINAPYTYTSLPTRTPSIYDKSRIVILKNDVSTFKYPKHADPKCVNQVIVNDIDKLKHKVKKTFFGKRLNDRTINLNQSSVAIQTEIYLQELCDRIEEKHCNVQTDDFLDRPPTPLFVPASTGVHVGTQILPNELFDFELEVVPLLEILVGKTIEQALIEVQQEEELANLRYRQEMFKQIYDADMMEIARLEELNRRHFEEKNRRIEQHKTTVKLAQEAAQKLSAKMFSQAYLEPLLSNTYEKLLDQGYFYDYNEHDIQINFMEPLINSVLDTVDTEKYARETLDNIIREAVGQRHHEFRELARSIYEKQFMKILMPEIRAEINAWIIERSTRMAISRLELTSNALKIIGQNERVEIMNELIDEVVTEVLAQEEAELAANEETESYTQTESEDTDQT